MLECKSLPASLDMTYIIMRSIRHEPRTRIASERGCISQGDTQVRDVVHFVHVVPQEERVPIPTLLEKPKSTNAYPPLRAHIGEDGIHEGRTDEAKQKPMRESVMISTRTHLDEVVVRMT